MRVHGIGVNGVQFGESLLGKFHVHFAEEIPDFLVLRLAQRELAQMNSSGIEIGKFDQVIGKE